MKHINVQYHFICWVIKQGFMRLALCQGEAFRHWTRPVHKMRGSVRMSRTRSLGCPMECPTESCPRTHSACNLAWIIGQDTCTVHTVKYSVQTQLCVQYIHRHLPVTQGSRPVYINTLAKKPCSLSYRAAHMNAEVSRPFPLLTKTTY